MLDSGMVPAATVDAILSGIAEPLLLAAGFRPGARRRWVRTFAPVRHVFELGALKSGAFVPRWGFSLDFVPHIKGGKTLAWHRTDKSALLDLVYDPIDFHADSARTWVINTLPDVDVLRGDAERVLPSAVKAALGWLDDAREPASVLERAEWLRTADRPGRRFGFDNYIQQPLAYAFLLARSGSGERAQQLLDEWITTYAVEHLRVELTTLLSAASS